MKTIPMGVEIVMFFPSLYKNKLKKLMRKFKDIQHLVIEYDKILHLVVTNKKILKTGIMTK